MTTKTPGSTALKGAARKWMDRHVHDPYVKQAKIVYIYPSYIITSKLTEVELLLN
jgi:hypothetical protein